jgi:hypothetical protein
MPHCECASGKMHHPIHLFLCVSHTFPLARMRLRALTPRAHSPLSLEGFSHFSKCACCGAIAPFPFSSLAALAPSFYCEHCLFFDSFLCKKKS